MQYYMTSRTEITGPGSITSCISINKLKTGLKEHNSTYTDPLLEATTRDDVKAAELVLEEAAVVEAKVGTPI
jgi:hypothetical protein